MEPALQSWVLMFLYIHTEYPASFMLRSVFSDTFSIDVFAQNCHLSLVLLTFWLWHNLCTVVIKNGIGELWWLPYYKITFVIFQIKQRMWGFAANKPHLCWKSTTFCCALTPFYMTYYLPNHEDQSNSTIDQKKKWIFLRWPMKLRYEIVGKSVHAKFKVRKCWTWDSEVFFTIVIWCIWN